MSRQNIELSMKQDARLTDNSGPSQPIADSEDSEAQSADSDWVTLIQNITSNNALKSVFWQLHDFLQRFIVITVHYYSLYWHCGDYHHCIIYLHVQCYFAFLFCVARPINSKTYNFKSFFNNEYDTSQSHALIINNKIMFFSYHVNVFRKWLNSGN